jgi:hypothetical protein
MGDDLEKKYMIEGEDCGRVAFPRSKHYGREGGGRWRSGVKVQLLPGRQPQRRINIAPERGGGA